MKKNRREDEKLAEDSRLKADGEADAADGGPGEDKAAKDEAAGPGDSGESDGREDAQKAPGPEDGGEDDGREDAQKAPGPEDDGEDDGKREDDGAPEDAQKATEPEAAGEEGDVKYLRLAADFQNYKRRMEKERFERYSEGKKDFTADLLPILDNFDRALAQDAELAKDEHDQAVIEGMAMIRKQFQDALEKNGVFEIEALGEDFDPNFHHAVIMEPTKDFESQKVSEVLQKGYRIGEKVIRPAMVKVAE